MTTKQTTIVTVSRNEMKTILEDNNTNQFISFISKTPQKMNDYLDYWLLQENGKKKKNPDPTVNPFKNSGVYKEQYKIDVLTGFGDYDNIIVNRLRKEGKSEEVISDFVNRHEIKKEEQRRKLMEKNPEMSDFEIEEEMELRKKEDWRLLLSNSLITDRSTQTKFYLRYVYTERTHSHPDSFTHNDNPIEKQLFEDYLTKKHTSSYSSQGLDHTFNIQICDLNHIVEITMNGTRYILTN